MPGPVVDALSLAVVTAGLVAGTAVLAVTRRPLFALAVLVDFLLAACLLRLAGRPGWPAIGAAAAVVALWQFLAATVRRGARSADLLRRAAGTGLVPRRRSP